MTGTIWGLGLTLGLDNKIQMVIDQQGILTCRLRNQLLFSRPQFDCEQSGCKLVEVFQNNKIATKDSTNTVVRNTVIGEKSTSRDRLT